MLNNFINCFMLNKCINLRKKICRKFNFKKNGTKKVNRNQSANLKILSFIKNKTEQNLIENVAFKLFLAAIEKYGVAALYWNIICRLISKGTSSKRTAKLFCKKFMYAVNFANCVYKYTSCN